MPNRSAGDKSRQIQPLLTHFRFALSGFSTTLYRIWRELDRDRIFYYSNLPPSDTRLHRHAKSTQVHSCLSAGFRWWETAEVA